LSPHFLGIRLDFYTLIIHTNTIATMRGSVKVIAVAALAPLAGTPDAAPTSASIDAALEAASSRPEMSVYESGIASTYGDGYGFEGLRTGCGGIFHTRQVQVAHKTLPCGTVVRIQDTDSGKSVDAEVTDRGPYVDGRIVDLSQAAFTQLDARGTGLLHVNVYVVDTSNQYRYRLR